MPPPSHEALADVSIKPVQWRKNFHSFSRFLLQFCIFAFLHFRKYAYYAFLAVSISALSSPILIIYGVTVEKQLVGPHTCVDEFSFFGSLIAVSTALVKIGQKSNNRG